MLLYGFAMSYLSGNLLSNGGHKWRESDMNTQNQSKTCTQCGETKPASLFKRRLTKRQTCALLKRPTISTGLVVDSVRCTTCWEKAKSKKPLTPKQIRNKISSGDMHSVIGEMMLKRIKEELPHKRSRAMKERWAKVKAEPILQLKDSLSKQVAQYARRHHSSRYLTPETKELNKWNYEQARKIKADIFIRIARGEVFDPDLKIATLIKVNPNIREGIKGSAEKMLSQIRKKGGV